MKPALHFPRIGKTLLAAALVAMAGTGCVEIQLIRTSDGMQVAQAGGTKGYASTAGSAIVGDITSAKALAFLYGGKVHQYSRPQKSSEKQGVVEAYAGKILQHAGQGGSSSPLGDECWEFTSWTPPVDGKYKEYFEAFEEYKGQFMAVCTLLDARYVENGVQKFMLGTSTYSQDITKQGGGHDMYTPRPMIGVAIFANEGGQWKLEAEDKYVTTGAWFQQSASLQRVGPEKWGMLLDYVAYLGGGMTDSGIRLLMPYGGHIKEFPLGGGSYEGQGIDSGDLNFSVSFDTASAGEYYDAVLRYDVLRRSGKTVKKSERLRFQNGEYVKAAKKGAKKGAKKRK